MGQWAGPKPSGPARPGPTFVWPKWAWAEKARAAELKRPHGGRQVQQSYDGSQPPTIAAISKLK
ncbi:hypothetical protein MTR_3g064990 [Medicago truncatula]|uniref:Uncharacterized protein n=1 Tax=Medicago truncatula TaxID=3880 RepID=G7J8Q0_MEDTR|nr:hypothetical protein MTR_3g064990 [Medicago truncatula]